MELPLSDTGLLALLADHVAKMLPADRVEELAERAIANHIGTLTIDQAGKVLQCANRKQALAECRRRGVPLRKLGNKKTYVLLADVERVVKGARP